MHERFLNGQDAEWIDYKEIDQDETLDDRQQMDRDEEDRWFNQEEEADKKQEGGETVYTGVLDY